MKTLHPRIMYTPPRGGVQGGLPPPAGSEGGQALGGGFGGESPEGKIAL
jgi:hypothetical protein